LDTRLQIILLVTTIAFLIYIINLVANRKLELHYALAWLVSTIGLIIITILPGAIELISDILSIKQPVNTLFLVITFGLILIILSLTKALSQTFILVNTLVQEVGLLKMEVDKLKSQK